jgi:condensin complex subunit 2
LLARRCDLTTVKQTSRHANTLEKSFAPLNVKKFDLAFDVDPLFKKTTAAFDEVSVKGLLMNQLSMDRDGNIIFDSMDVAGGEDASQGDDHQEEAHEDTEEGGCDLSTFISKLFYWEDRIAR